MYFSKFSDSNFCQGFFRFCEHPPVGFQEVHDNRKPYSNGSVLKVANFQLSNEKNPRQKIDFENFEK